MILTKKLVICLLGFGLLNACSSTTEKEMEEKIANEPGVAAPGGMAMQSENIIKESTKLSETQKSQLLGLHQKTQEQMTKIRMELSKVKGTFFKTLTTAGTKNKDLDMMKKKMTDLHGQKLTVMLKSLDEAKTILGDVNDEKIFESFMYEDTHHSVR
jgi:hypothetical protein